MTCMMTLKVLQENIIQCTLCPRLTTYRQEVARIKVKRFQDWDYWGRPIPGFGEPNAKLFVIGLAPAAQGGNRTGRVFTGDRSGDWLYEALYTYQFANQAESIHKHDGLRLKDCYVAAAVRCAPPGNKPTPEEFANCRPFLLKELRLLKKVRVIVVLGKIAFDEYFKACRQLGHVPSSPRPTFGHGATYQFSWGVTLISSYHPSQQNTFTGKLTRPMFHQVFAKARHLVSS
jgi:uracil-DNA glycosylase family 4